MARPAKKIDGDKMEMLETEDWADDIRRKERQARVDTSEGKKLLDKIKNRSRD